jgi:hypothetical protein
MAIEIVADERDVQLPALQRTRVRTDRRYRIGELSLGDRPPRKIGDGA